MNKYAAEKIAQEYYELGVSTFLNGMAKVANPLVADAMKGLQGLARGRGNSAAKAIRAGTDHARPIGPVQFPGVRGHGEAFDVAQLRELQNLPTGGRARPFSRIPAEHYNEVTRNLAGPNALQYIENNPNVYDYLNAGLGRSGLGGLTPEQMLRELPGHRRGREVIVLNK